MMASLDGISFDVTTRQATRTILSSVGGFSSARQNIRSLQDLLATIQRLDLDVFDSRTLRRDGFIGEGVSYKVTRCVQTTSNRLFAVKTVKLPHQSADARAFERQVSCVLRDIEVMYGLARQSNILDIYGYGWDIDSGNVIPYLVTEFAAEGTLRNFLKNNELSVHEKLLFCKDVSQGLHSLHVAGIAHGDLKLDNVLVTPYIGRTISPMEHMLRTTGMEACISDFGHSLHLYDDEGDYCIKQRYGGTLAYNAPEIIDRHRSNREDVNFRICDMWSLGLALWEILIDGKAYYHNAEVEDSIKRRTNSVRTPTLSDPPSQASSSALIEELVTIAPQLAQTACKDVSEKTRGTLTYREVGRLHVVFRMCLAHDPKRRLADIAFLPFFNGQKLSPGIAAAPSRIQAGNSTSWSFEVRAHLRNTPNPSLLEQLLVAQTGTFYNLFRITDSIPDEVKKQIIYDCQKVANELGVSILTARACFQLGLAYATGFGVSPVSHNNMKDALHWFEKSAERGLHIAELYLPSLRSLCRDGFTSHGACLERFLAANKRAFKAKYGSMFIELDHLIAVQDPESEQLNEKVLDNLTTREDIDAHDEYGNTGMTLVAKFGISSITRELLRGGASATVPDTDGSIPLHWLFMYPDNDIAEMTSALGGERVEFAFTAPSESSREKVHIARSINHMVPFKTPINLDPQLPLLLSGTPLAFAVSVGCTTSVRSLLALGADPLLGLNTSPRQVEEGSPLAIAFSLHMADVLRLLLEHILKCGYRETRLLRLLNGLQQHRPAPQLQRAMIHGPFMQSAAEATFHVLLSYYRFSSQYPLKWDILKPAAVNMDPFLCSAILKALESYRPQLSLTNDDLDALMYRAIAAACQPGRNLTVAIELLELAIQAGASINYHTRPVATDTIPLFLAIDRQDGEILDWIIEQPNVDLAVRDCIGLTALHRVLISGMSSRYDIRKLITKNAELPNIESWEGNTPIELVTTDRKLEEFRILRPYVPMKLRQRLLEIVVIADAPKLVNASLEDIENLAGVIHLNRALSLAAEVASGEVAQVLLSFGAQAIKTSGSFFSTMHEAASHGNIDMLNLCIRLQHDVNQKSIFGTPLMLATTTLIKKLDYNGGAQACVHALLDANANPECKDRSGRTPLALLLESPSIVRTNCTALIEKLLRKGADPNAHLKSQSSLLKSIREKDWALAVLLVQHGANLDQHSDGQYPLHMCARADKSSGLRNVDESRPAALAALLLEQGSDPFKRGKKGLTALEQSLHAGNGPVLLRILEHIVLEKIVPKVAAEADIMPAASGSEQGPKKSRWILRNKTEDDKTRAKEEVEKASPMMKIRAKVLESPDIQEAWGYAVFGKYYFLMAAFFKARACGSLDYLNRRTALSLLRYALIHEFSFVLIQFMGGEDDDGVFEQPDEYLKSIWNSIRDYSPWIHKPERLMTISDVATSMMGKLVLLNGAFPELDEEQYKQRIASDEDIPPKFSHYYYRLQYMSAIDRYTKALPASHLVARGYVEAQGERDLKEAVVDEDAERKRQEYIAQQSILGPIARDEFTDDSGF